MAFNGKVAAVVKAYTQGNPDKNGKDPVILQVVAGTSPNRTILSGTIAEREGFVVGNAYLTQIKEGDENEFGRQFIFSNIGVLGTMDLLSIESHLGEPVIFDVVQEVDTSTGEMKPSVAKKGADVI